MREPVTGARLHLTSPGSRTQKPPLRSGFCAAAGNRYMKPIKLITWIAFVAICILVALIRILEYTNGPLSIANIQFLIIFGLANGSLSALPILLAKHNKGHSISNMRWCISITFLLLAGLFEYGFIAIASS
jgi:hypothetical protein